MHTFVRDPQTGHFKVRTPLRGAALLTHPLLNKGSAFSPAEREGLALQGLLPAHVSSLQDQVQRAYEGIDRKDDVLEKYIGLASIQDRNETLFFRLLSDHIEEMMPLVYTPVVGDAIVQYSKIFRRPRGLWITPDDRGRMKTLLANAPSQDIRLIVVTDNERILGLGDQGAGGIGIPIGKLSLYTAVAGIHPSQVLPISLDVGTDNAELCADPLYLGWRQPRLRGTEYRAVVDEFVDAVREVFPRALLQWEDFKKQNAFDNLELYHSKIPSFNDDIEGTAGVALAGILSAAKVTGIPLADQRVLIVGAGAAGIGIGRLVRSAMATAGLGGDALTRGIAILDSKGLLHDGRTFRDVYKKEFAWPQTLATEAGLSDTSALAQIVAAFKPTVLIGTTGRAGSFDEEAVRAMAKATPRPAIFPFSNPTANAEAHPADLLRWTDGAALVATGSPFGVIRHGDRDIRIGQGNNVYIFPGIGLGSLAAGVTKVVPQMFAVAAAVLADHTSEADLAEGALFPSVSKIRDVTREIGYAVARCARDQGVAPQQSDAQLKAAVDTMMWDPEYPVIERE